MLDAARGVVAQQGLLGLYSGLSVTLLEIVPYAALQFGLYDLFTAAAASARTRVSWRHGDMHGQVAARAVLRGGCLMQHCNMW